MSSTFADGTPAPFQKKDLLGSGVTRQADGSYRPEPLFPKDLAANHVGETFQITIQFDEIRRCSGTTACFLPYSDHPSAPQAQKEKQEYRLTISPGDGPMTESFSTT